jgi:hypothetical protein
MTNKRKQSSSDIGKKCSKTPKTKFKKIASEIGYSKTATAAICYWYNSSNR